MQMEYVGGKRKTVKKPKRPVPRQLKQWHEFLTNYWKNEAKPRGDTYAEAMSDASELYKGGAKRRKTSSKGRGMSAHSVAGRSAHEIAGKKRKPSAKRGGTVGQIVDAVGDLLGLGKARKPRAKKAAPKKAGSVLKAIGRVADLLGNVTGLGKKKAAPKKRAGATRTSVGAKSGMRKASVRRN